MSRRAPYKESLRHKIAGLFLGEPIWQFEDRANTDGFAEGIRGFLVSQIKESISKENSAMSISQIIMSLEDDNWVKIEFYAKRENK